MKKPIIEFIRRGLTACGFGPTVLAVIYLILHRRGLIQSLTVSEVCTGIFSLTGLAFMAGGLNILYQIERLPLAAAILIHGGVLYICYLATFLINGWLEGGAAPLLIFTAVFAVGYLLIWAGIYLFTRRRTQRLNRMLESRREAAQ